MITDQNREIYHTYFQKNSDYYIRQIEMFEENGRFSISIAALLGGVFWMVYRKMYKLALIIFILMVTQTFVQETLLNFDIISNATYELVDKISMLLWSITLGLISNRLYVSNSQKVIQKVLAEHSSEEQIAEQLSEEGGVNPIAPFALIFLIGLLIYISI